MENRIIELITLGSRGKITTYIPNSDDDGIDLIANLKGDFKPLFIQVKSRFKLNKKNRYLQNVSLNTYKSHPAFYIAFVYFSLDAMEIETLWLVPSYDFERLAFVTSASNKEYYRFSANPSESSDHWEMYKIHKQDFGKKIYDIIRSL